MCGIAGLINKSGGPADRQWLERMTELVRHRGPDGTGYAVSGNVGLGHQRLAILDLSEAASQPMHSSDCHFTITFNGEIYNYLELREQLQRCGHHFVSRSDTEVILAAYSEWGAECVQRFNGMWAFAIHDRARNLLFCSRDRFGVKPFYFIDNGTLFAFGSEIKQLLDLLPTRAANSEIMSTFLLTGLLDYSASTFFDGVQKLLPGHNLLVDLQSGAVYCRQYYKLQAVELGDATGEEIESRFLGLLENSIELRLRSDVPVGTCLSGGIDSSAIAALAAARYAGRSGTKFRAVTAISTDPATDESRHAREMVKWSRLDWLSFTPLAEDFAEVMAMMSYHQDEPVPSASPMMQYFVMRTARENGIPVLLDGQGADEILLGYRYYMGMYVRSVYREKGAAAALRALHHATAQNERLSYASTVKYALGMSFPKLRHMRSLWQSNYLRSTARAPQVLRDIANACRDWSSFQTWEIGAGTLPALLRYEDRNSMAFGVEARLPFLDYRLVELCLGLPVEYKIRNGWTKWVLRKCMAGTVPESILWRKDKIGFEAPDEVWMDAQESTVQRTITASDLVRSVTDEARLKASLASLPLGNRWRLYSVAVWGEQFGIDTATFCPQETLQVKGDEAVPGFAVRGPKLA
jgi:asparagine synthase (glutamine-hydrolysing)